MIKKVLCITISIIFLFTSFAFAEEFNNDSPSKWVITPIPIQDGAEGNAIIYDKDGNPLHFVTIYVTSYEDREKAPTKEIKDDLIRSYFRLNHTLTVVELVKELGVEFRNAKNERVDDSEIKTALGWDMVISDVFDVSLLENEKELLKAGNKIVFKLKTPLKDDELWFLIHNYEGDKWEYVVDATIEGSIVTCTLDSLSCFAFVRVRKLHYIWPESLLMLILLLILVLVKRKKDNRREEIEELRAKKILDAGLVYETIKDEPLKEDASNEEIDDSEVEKVDEALEVGEIKEDMELKKVDFEENKNFNELLDEFLSQEDED